jgi:hypothetical protein
MRHVIPPENTRHLDRVDPVRWGSPCRVPARGRGELKLADQSTASKRSSEYEREQQPGVDSDVSCDSCNSSTDYLKTTTSKDGSTRSKRFPEQPVRHQVGRRSGPGLP